jgi:putative acetyltransferase
VFDTYSQVSAAMAEPVVTIRPEQETDHEQVFRVNELAFGQPDEARLVQALRRSPAFIPELSLVAVEDERIVGHILFSRISVRSGTTTHEALALAPMAVLPARQRMGIGSSLVRRGLADARHLEHRVVIVVGHPEYYPRFGFVPGEPLGVTPPFEVSPGAFMLLELQPNALAGVRGEVQYPPEFGEL